MKPHPDNACSGKYEDWLDVNLLPDCNARCAWCIERGGWHPVSHAPWQTIVAAALSTDKTNVILLGGEPTMHGNLREIVEALVSAGRKVWITTNGSLLSSDFVEKNLRGVAGVNISIHSANLQENYDITGISLCVPVLLRAVQSLHKHGATIRLNCNCIKGYLDSAAAIRNYVKFFAIPIGANAVRFAELKGDDEFVNLAEVAGKSFGLTNNPFEEGCSVDREIDGLPVNFRLMCGLQTPHRMRPDNPEQVLHDVLYYDGQLYAGWQTKEAGKMEQVDVMRRLIREKVERGEMSVDEAKEANEWLDKQERDSRQRESNLDTGGGCMY